MTTNLTIQNLKCGGCAHTITTKLSELHNITNVIVDVESSTVGFNHQSIKEAALVKNKLSTLGYPIEGDVNTTVSKAKSYVSCAVGKMTK